MKKFIVIILCLLCVTSFWGCSKNKNVAQQPDLSQIRSICQLSTLECYYHNVAKSVKTPGSGIAHIGEVKRKFWIEYTGVVKLGIDLSRVKMTVNKNKIIIFLPQATLHSVSVHPQDLNNESYITSGDSWFNQNKITAADQTQAIENAQNEMKAAVLANSSLMISAQTRAMKLIENYINRLGELSGTTYQIEWQLEEITPAS